MEVLTLVSTLVILIPLIFGARFLTTSIVKSDWFENKYDGPMPDNYVKYGLLDYAKFIGVIALIGFVGSLYT